jgi:hypothetical protein
MTASSCVGMGVGHDRTIKGPPVLRGGYGAVKARQRAAGPGSIVGWVKGGGAAGVKAAVAPGRVGGGLGGCSFRFDSGLWR